MRNFVRYHPRLWISVGTATAVFFLLPAHWALLSRVLVCWNCGVTLFLVLVFLWMRRLSAEQICTQYIEEDESAPIILAVVTVAALLSVVAIIEPLASLKQVTGEGRAALCALAALAMDNAWVLVAVMFTSR